MMTGMIKKVTRLAASLLSFPKKTKKTIKTATEKIDIPSISCSVLIFGKEFPNQTSKKGVNKRTPNASCVHLDNQISGRFSPMENCEYIARMLKVAEMTGLKITPRRMISRIELIFSSANEKLFLFKIKYVGKKAARELPRAINIENPTGSPFDNAIRKEPIRMPGSESRPSNKTTAMATPI